MWFTRALHLDESAERLEGRHRLRIGSLRSRCPKLLHLWPTRYPIRTPSADHIIFIQQLVQFNHAIAAGTLFERLAEKTFGKGVQLPGETLANIEQSDQIVNPFADFHYLLGG